MCQAANPQMTSFPQPHTRPCRTAQYPRRVSRSTYPNHDAQSTTEQLSRHVAHRTRNAPPPIPFQPQSSPSRLLHLRTPPSRSLPLRSFSTSSHLLKKAGKANKAHARSDSSPPVSSLSPATPTDEALDVSSLESQILKALERLTHELSQLRSGGRLNPEIVEGLKVQLGTQSSGKETVRLGDVAQVVPKGRVLNVMVGEPDVRSLYCSFSPNLESVEIARDMRASSIATTAQKLIS